MFLILLYSKLSASITIPVLIALDFPFVKKNSLFFKYVIFCDLIIIFSFSSIISTLPKAISMFLILSYSKFFAFITVPSSEVTVPPFFPINLLPSSIISNSVTSKLKISAPLALKLIK